MSPLAHPKGKTPSRSSNLRKGVFLRLAPCQSLSLWERCRRRRRRGQARQERAAAQRWAGFLSERYYRCVWDSPSAALPSQSRRPAPRQLPQRGSHWHVGQLSSGRAKHNISETVVLRCLGQRQLDKERCPEAAALCGEARPFTPYRASGVQ